MRSSAWTGSGAALGLSLLGISLGAGLAGLVALGGAGEARAQGMMMMPMEGYGYRSGKAVRGYRAPAPRAKRAKRYYYRSPAVKTCGQFKYWSTEKGRCLDARTTPPDLK